MAASKVSGVDKGKIALTGKRERRIATSQRCVFQFEPLFPGLGARGKFRLAGAVGVTGDRVRCARRQGHRFLRKVFQRGNTDLRRTRHRLFRSDACRAKFVVDMAAAMASPNVKYRSGFPNGNFFRQAVRAEGRKTGLPTMRTSKRIHISSRLIQLTAESLFPSFERNFDPKLRLTPLGARGQCIGWLLRRLVVCEYTGIC